MMKQRLLLCLVFARLLPAQEAPGPVPELSTLPVLSQTVVPQKDGGSITFQRTAPPAVLPARTPPPEVLTAEEQATRQRREGKEPELLSISASVHEGGLTLLRCAVDGRPERLEALSSVDFRLLTGIGSVETETKVYTLILAVGQDHEPLPPAEAALVPALLQAGAFSFVTLKAAASLTAEEQQAVTSMEVLHQYLATHHAALAQLQAQRGAQQAARELAQRNAPPKPPQHDTIRFWKLPPQPLPVVLQPAPAAKAQAANPGEGGAAQP